MIRPYHAGDAPSVERCIVELQNFERTLEADRVEGHTIAARNLAELRASCQRKRGQIFVAEVERRVVGFVCVWLEQEAETYLSTLTQYACISDIVVLPDVRGQGLGRALLEEAEAFARAQGAPALKINVLARNAMAHQVYHAAGFRDYEVSLIKPLAQDR
jgi:aminoglycoside 6'-N-acetyltransferase I